MGNDRNGSGLGQMPEHLTQKCHRHMRPRPRTRLQDDWNMFSFGRLHIGAGILPPLDHDPGHGIAAKQRRGQHVGQRCNHLNLAIMSLMPGIVSI